MAANDSAAQNGTEKLSTNALTTVNGTNVAADVIEVQRIKVGFGSDGVLLDVDASNNLPVTDTKLAALQDSINTLNETMLVMLSAIFEKMPRVQANDRMVCDLSETSLPTVSTVSTLTAANDLLRLQGFGSSTINVTKAADAIPVHISNVGALHLYDKILVS